MFHIVLGAIDTISNCEIGEEIQFSTRMMVGLGRLMRMMTLARLSTTLELSIVLLMLVLLE